MEKDDEKDDSWWCIFHDPFGYVTWLNREDDYNHQSSVDRTGRSVIKTEKTPKAGTKK